MASIIKTADCVQEAVVVGGSRPRRFRPSDYQGGKPLEEDAAGQTVLASLETAIVRAKRIVADAEAVADCIRKEAAARGYQEGLAKGLAEARERSQEHLRRMTELAENVRADRETVVQTAEQDLIALVLMIAEKVIHHEVSIDPSIIVSTVRAAIDRIATPEQLRILVNPEDIVILRDEMTQVVGGAGLGFQCQLVGDEKIERGGCLVETRGGLVDARIETQMARFTAALEAG